MTAAPNIPAKAAAPIKLCAASFAAHSMYAATNRAFVGDVVKCPTCGDGVRLRLMAHAGAKNRYVGIPRHAARPLLQRLIASIEADIAINSTPAPVFDFAQWQQLRDELRAVIAKAEASA